MTALVDDAAYYATMMMKMMMTFMHSFTHSLIIRVEAAALTIHLYKHTLRKRERERGSR